VSLLLLTVLAAVPQTLVPVPVGPGPGIPEPAGEPFAGSALPQDTGLVDIDAYDINVRLEPSRHFLRARTRIVFRSVAERLGSVRFVLYNDTLRIGSVTSGPDTLVFAYDSAAATLTVLLSDSLDPGEADSVLVEYSGFITPALSGALDNYCRLDGTLGFSILPYTWYPAGYDRYYSSRRDDTFACRTTLTVPAGWRALGVGVLADSASTESTRTWTWQSGRQVTAASFAAAAFRQSVRSIGGLTVRYCDFDTSAVAAVFGAAGSILGYLDRTFGPIPLTELSYVENLQVYGAAAAGLVMMPLPYQLSGQTHETAHQWWGLALRLRYAPEAWLNEGFASYSEVLFQEDSLGLPVRWAELDTMARRYRNVPRAQDRPIVPAPNGSNYYFTIVYNKGAWVLHMLRWVLGDALFFTAMDHYALAGADSSVTVAGFRGVAEDVSGMDLGWFFDEWLYRIGYPKYRLDWSLSPAGDSSRVVTRLDQVNGSGAPACFRTPVPVLVEGSPADTTIIVRPLANPQVDTFVVAGRPNRLVVDPDDWLLDSSYVAPVGLADRATPAASRFTPPTVVRGVLNLPGLGTRSQLPGNWVMSRAVLLDASGRRVLSLRPGLNDVSRLAPGVYFVRSSTDSGHPSLSKVIIAR
jgi:hypothetical protein